MQWYEYLIIAFAITLVIGPIITFVQTKKKGTLKCECGHLQSECTGNCSSCSIKQESGCKKTITYILTIEGMKCGMCESHINDVIRKNFDVVKVKSSRNSKNTMITSDHLLNLRKLKSAISSIGYQVISIKLE